MALLYRVTLTGIKGFYWVYKISGNATLYSLHRQLQSDLEFPQDQLILFKALDEGGSVVARYGLFDLGDGAVDDVTMAQTRAKGIVSFVYFYDVAGKKSVNVTFDGETPEAATSPTIVEAKGPNPIEFEKGYVAFEDLPDEKRHLPGEERKRTKLEELLNIRLDDEDVEDEEDEDESGEEDDDAPEEVYDESENAIF